MQNSIRLANLTSGPDSASIISVSRCGLNCVAYLTVEEPMIFRAPQRIDLTKGDAE
jgi:hypothetical protein